MLIPIPVGQKYTATMSATVPKLVKCEQCSTDYVYHLKRKAVGEGTSLLFLNNKGAKGSAQAEARKRLLKVLARSCEPVPCPACGHVQEHMIPRARQLRCRWVGKAALYLFPSGCLLGLAAAGVLTLTMSNAGREGWTASYVIWMIIGAMAGLTAAAGVIASLVLPVWRYFSCRRYDPNTEKVEVRKARGQSLAVTKTEFDRRQVGQASSQGSTVAQPTQNGSDRQLDTCVPPSRHASSDRPRPISQRGSSAGDGRAVGGSHRRP